MSIEYNTISNISELLNEYGREYQIIPNNEIFSREYICDAFIYKKNVLIAVVEFKNLYKRLANKGILLNRLLHYANKVNASYCILCNDTEGYFYKANNYNNIENIEVPLSNLELIIRSIIEEINNLEEKFNPNEILSIFRQTKNECNLNNRQFNNFIDELDVDYIKNNISKLPDGRFSLSEEFERKFFTNMLIDREFNQLCRYTSLSSTIRIIKEKKASVCSIACMNDKSECYYFDQYINNIDKIDYSSLSPYTIKEINSTFISSCAEIESKDKLTMWRMYGNDAKGTCLIYNIDKDLLDNNFFIAPISYAEKDKKHPYIEFIKKLLEKDVCFNQLNIWKHFFKPVDYKDEKEIRLLYFCDDESKFKWIQSSDEIFCPIIEFPINDGNNKYPLIIEEIILGPKCSEKITNRQQLQLYCSYNKIPKKVNITLSEIDNYR